MSLLRISNSFRNWMIIWVMLIIGHVVGSLIYGGLPNAFEIVSWEAALLSISAIVFAAMGPLFIVMFFLILFREEGGTAMSILSLVCGVPLLYWGVVLLVRKTMNAESRFLKWLLRVALAGYSALSTFALLYGCSII